LPLGQPQLPALQTAPLVVHSFVQPPQWLGLVWRSTQTPLPHAVSGLAQEALQLPPTQYSPVLHSFVQLPQELHELERSTQQLLHLAVPVGQTVAWHLPPTQLVPVGQTTPQAPQLALFARSTQIPLQVPQPAGQVQTPFTQAPVPQLDPQVPQFARSLSRFTQVGELA
jgi:hypothetical protein